VTNYISVSQIRERNQQLSIITVIKLCLFSVGSYSNLAHEQAVELYRLLKLKFTGNWTKTVSGRT